MEKYNPYGEGHVKPSTFSTEGFLVWEVVAKSDTAAKRAADHLQAHGFEYGKHERQGIRHQQISGWTRKETA